MSSAKLNLQTKSLFTGLFRILNPCEIPKEKDPTAKNEFYGCEKVEKSAE